MTCSQVISVRNQRRLACSPCSRELKIGWAYRLKPRKLSDLRLTLTVNVAGDIYEFHMSLFFFTASPTYHSHPEPVHISLYVKYLFDPVNVR